MSFFHNQLMKQSSRNRDTRTSQYLVLKNIFLQSKVTMNLFEIAFMVVIAVIRIFFVGCIEIIFLRKIGRRYRLQDVRHQEI